MLGMAKVHDLEVVVGVEHHVLKLQVAVEHAVFVHVLDTIEHLAEVKSRNLFRKLLDSVAKDEVVVEFSAFAEIGGDTEEHLAGAAGLGDGDGPEVDACGAYNIEVSGNVMGLSLQEHEDLLLNHFLVGDRVTWCGAIEQGAEGLEEDLWRMFENVGWLTRV